MEKWKFITKNNGKKVAIYFGNSERDIIMKVWLTDNSIMTWNECVNDTLEIPFEVIETLRKS